MNWRGTLTNVRRIGGYVLFAIAVAWVVWQVPRLQVSLAWGSLSAALCIMSLMLPLEIAQFRLFLVSQRRSYHLGDMSRLVVQKGLLNSIAPAQAGTLIVMHELTTKLGITWHSFVRYTVLTSILGAFASLVLYGATLTSLWIGGGLIAIVTVATGIPRWVSRRPMMALLPELWFISIGLLLVRVPVFWLLFQALGHPITWGSSLTVGIAMNGINQFPITPGNLGVRELTLAGLAEWAGVEGPIGALVGLLFAVGRVAVYALVYLVLLSAVRRKESAAEEST